MENEEYLDIEDGLSVGTMKIANKYDIFTEEEIDAINNKIPELDERVGIVEDEIEEINSSLDDMEIKKATKQEVDVERKRIDTFTKLNEGSTTGDAELIDGRIGADGKTYSNIGSAIRNQISILNNIYDFSELKLPVKDLVWDDGYKAEYGNATIVGTGSTYKYTKIDVLKGEKYFISGYSFSSQRIFVFVSKSGEITTFPTETISIVKQHSTDFIVPEDGVLYINKNYQHEIEEHIIERFDNVIDCIKKEYVSKYLKNDLKGLKWTVIGDSLSAKSTLGEDKTYHDYISEKNGMIVNNLAIGGQGYMTGSDNFITQSLKVPTDSDIVTIFGSFNDWSNMYNNIGTLGDTSTDTLHGCVYNVLKNIIDRVPNAKIGVILPCSWSQFSWENATPYARTTKIPEFLNTIKNTCNEIFNVPVLDLYHDSNIRAWDLNFQKEYYIDAGVHPNTLGHKKYIAPLVETFIEHLFKNY